MGDFFSNLFGGTAGKAIITAGIQTVGGLLMNHFNQAAQDEQTAAALAAKEDDRAFTAAENEKNRQLQLALAAMRGGGGGGSTISPKTRQAAILQEQANRENQILASLMGATNQALL